MPRSISTSNSHSLSDLRTGAVAQADRNEHLVFVVRTVEYGGTEKHLLSLLSRFDGKCRCTILCFGTDFYRDRLPSTTSVEVRVCERGRADSFGATAWLLVGMHPSAVVFVKGSMGDFGISSFLAARMAGVSSVWAIEHLEADPLPEARLGSGLRSWLSRHAGWHRRERLLRRAQGRMVTGTICVSETVRKRLVADYGYPADSTVTVLNGTDIERLRPIDGTQREALRAGLGLRAEDVVIVCAARLSQRKRIDLLLESLSILSEDSPPWRCLILGAGPLERELKRLADSLGLSRRVRFEGFVEDIRPAMSAGDIYASASDKEGFGLTLIEAMACGVPCVATRLGSHAEIVEHRQTGLLVDPGSSTQLAAALSELLLDKAERLRMGANARKRVEHYFDLDSSMARIEQLIIRHDSCAPEEI